MPRCGRSGVCGCNDERCEEARWWWCWCMSWVSVAWAMAEETGYKRPNRFASWCENVEEGCDV